MKRVFRTVLLAALVAAGASCSTPKTLNYLQDISTDSVYVAQRAPEVRILPDDKLSIKVFSSDPQLAAPFNSWGAGADASAVSYVVDKDGFIDFPVLGSLKVEGMTLYEVKKNIQEQIQTLGYIKDPIVIANIDNFNITVIGKAGYKNVTVKGGSMNILQLIAETNGTDNSADIKELTVLRTEDDTIKPYTVNLKTVDLFNSPVFYLQQNDVVYIKHRGVQMSPTGSMVLGITGTALGATSTIAYILLWTGVGRNDK